MLDTKQKKTWFVEMRKLFFCFLTSRRFRSSSRRLAISRFCRCSSSIFASCCVCNDDVDEEFWRFDGGDGDVSDSAAEELCLDELRNALSLGWLPFVSLGKKEIFFQSIFHWYWLTFEVINVLVLLHLHVF